MSPRLLICRTHLFRHLVRCSKAIDLMLTQLGGALPRELTGRTRYRAWGIV
jgi:hypothetical protein